MMMFSLESSVARDAFERVIDAFVDGADLGSFGFAHATSNGEVRPSFHPSVLLKLYLYGYHNGIRSFVRLLRDLELVDGQTIAIDSFKIRAQNSLKNNLNQNKIDRHLEYIDNKIAEYETLLDQSDCEEDKQELKEKIQLRQNRKGGYKTIEQQLKESGQEQISLTDPDSRSVVLHRNIVNVDYNIQASSDSKHKLLAEFKTGDVKDTHALAQMATATKEILKAKTIDVLADKGYHTGEELKKCGDQNITAFVSPKAPATPDNGLYPVTAFTYNKNDDTYTCPSGETLRTNNVWYKHSGKGKTEAYRFLCYTTPACKTCASRSKCTAGNKNGRTIDRSEYAPAIEANRERVTAKPDYYRLRQQITEHPFDTLKRQRGFTFPPDERKNKGTWRGWA